MAESAAGCFSCASIKAFMQGPDFITITAAETALEKSLQQSLAAADASEAAAAAGACEAPIVEISLRPAQDETAGAKKKAAGQAKLGKPPVVGAGAYRCTSAVGTQLSGKCIESFDQSRQVYSKAELSPLPFQPPAAYTYFVTMLSGTFKVFQYVITIMVALMVTQHAIERYWSAGRQVTSFQMLMFVLFVSHPLLTLLLVVLSNNEIAARRFMYYRLMSLQVIVDWENTPVYKMWFCIYFAVTFCLINIYSLYTSWLTWSDKTTSVLPQWSIMFMQSMLLFMFWFNMVSLEEQLVPLNKVIENSPDSAKELTTKCTVVAEKALKAAIFRTTARKRAFKRLTAAEQEAAAAELLGDSGDSAAAFFDLLALRRTGRNRAKQEDVAAEEPQSPQGCLARLYQRLCAMSYQRLYALNFCMAFFSLTLFKASRHGKPGPHMWPYAGDVRCFRAMAILGALCTFSVVAVEAYAIWFLLYAKDISDRYTYGVLECKQCYGYITSAGETCRIKPADNSCRGAAELGYCAMRDALLHGYGMNATTWLDSAGSAAYLPAVPAV